jgi:hypothetical protein
MKCVTFARSIVRHGAPPWHSNAREHTIAGPSVMNAGRSSTTFCQKYDDQRVASDVVGHAHHSLRLATMPDALD